MIVLNNVTKSISNIVDSAKQSVSNCSPNSKVLKTCSWNIRGLTIDKLDKNVIGNVIKQFDIVDFSETWLRDDMDIDGFISLHFMRDKIHKNAHRGAGGISVFMKNDICNSISLLKHYYDSVLYC